MRWPRELSPGSVSQQAISAQDLYPTLAAAAGVPVRDELKLDGKNLWQAIQSGGLQDRDPLLISAASSALFNGDWKLIETANGQISLFQITQDPGETTNLTIEQSEVAVRLHDKLSELTQGFPALRTGPSRPLVLQGKPQLEHAGHVRHSYTGSATSIPRNRLQPNGDTVKHAIALLKAFIAAPWATLHAADSALPSKPNIIFILADDLGIGNVGCYGADN